MKTIESRIAPNPKEAQIWIDLSADAHGLVKKYWNGSKWVVKENNVINTKDIIEELKPIFNQINDTFEDIKYNGPLVDELINKYKELGFNSLLKSVPQNRIISKMLLN